MASIARCLRAARPSTTFSRLAAATTPRAPPGWQLRAFSASPCRDLRRYTKDHEWIDVSADKTTGVVGISEYAAKALGDVVYVELPEVGREVQAGDAIGAVESVKSAADINSPVSCTVVAVNRPLEERPGIISEVPEDDAHGGGWIAKVELSDQGRKDFDALLNPDEYAAFTDAEH
ncbi:glycine cleavage system H protein [Durotheca rogersii]|uniref:glycine cleavage system H protein n=1 Tax=Durotheca rogersii TaxID=419775 RepID=UPI00221F9676|nr:glycine cleavage system H protein [Durotheca rogersii]KAI5859451.1 glycine cleavage system H protein [Durotheca rogersii]